MPPAYVAEMAPFDPLIGEYRVHYAGFFDPGFGYAEGKAPGAKAVLEVRSLDIPFILEDGQIVGRLVYDKLTDIPDQIYGQGIGSHYQAQGLKLSKHFKQARLSRCSAIPNSSCPRLTRASTVTHRMAADRPFRDCPRSRRVSPRRAGADGSPGAPPRWWLFDVARRFTRSGRKLGMSLRDGPKTRGRCSEPSSNVPLDARRIPT